MPSKSASPEAAQKRVWKAEIKDLEKARGKVEKDFETGRRLAFAEMTKANKAAALAQKNYNDLLKRHDKKRPRALASINSRIAILRGRL